METINIKVKKVTEEDFEIKLPFFGQIGHNLVAIAEGIIEIWYSHSPEYISSSFKTGLSAEDIFHEVDFICGSASSRVTVKDIKELTKKEFLLQRAELYNSMI